MPRPTRPEASAYLDIETSWQGDITVVGIYSRLIGSTQLVRPGITRQSLLELLEGVTRLVTFNGSCFDLPVIRKQLGVDLKAGFGHFDLRFACARRGLKGGLKNVERLLGVQRDSEGITGIDAMRLWDLHQAGDAEALRTLLRYNRDDIENLPIIESKVLRLAAAG